MIAKKIVFPEPLKRGDRVAIVSPSSRVKDEYVDGAANFLRQYGYEPIIFPHAKGPASGNYAASREERLSDLRTAFADTGIKAILCARGGYGAVELIGYIPKEALISRPKWVIGFSDISAIHAMMLTAGVASIHAPMAKHITEQEPGEESVESLLSILEEGLPTGYCLECSPQSADGIAQGTLCGGNLAVLSGLVGTPFDIFDLTYRPDTILFIEDIGEAIYRVDRMLWRMYLSGTFSRVKGLIFGQFSDYRPDPSHNTMEELLRERMSQWGIDRQIPIVYGFPCGHEQPNLPLVEGAQCRLKVERGNVELMMARELPAL